MGVIVVCGAETAGAAIRELLPNAELVETAAARISSPSAAVILGSGGRLSADRALGVILSGEDDSAEQLPQGVQVITVGHGAKNTVSITSITPDTLTLSLNRAMNTLRGIAEPFELPVPVRNADNQIGYMAAFAAGVLLGEISAEGFEG